MSRQTEALISTLAGDLRPVRPLRFSNGLLLALSGLALSSAGVVAVLGLRSDLAALRLDPVHLVSSGLFAMLGLAATSTVVMMSSPWVGSNYRAWRWPAVMAALVPVAGMISTLGRGGVGRGAAEPGLVCTMMGFALGLATFGVLVGWLRRGAPTSPALAGTLTGIAAGCFGIFAFSLHCPSSDIVHIGLWHSLAVALSAAVGWLAVPRMIRW